MKYAFIKRHEHEHSVRRMCRVMSVHPSGYYAWKGAPISARGKDDQRLLGLLKHAWLESGGIYGYRKLTMDMRDPGETAASIVWPACSNSKACVQRLAIVAGLARVVASQQWWRPTICSASSMSVSPTSPG